MKHEEIPRSLEKREDTSLFQQLEYYLRKGDLRSLI